MPGQEVVIPASLLELSLDGALGRVELAGIERPPAQQGEVLRAVVLAAPGDWQVVVRLSPSTARRWQTRFAISFV